MNKSRLSEWSFSSVPSLFAAGLGMACASCITSATTSEVSKPIVEFPSARALAEIEARPATVPSVDTGEIPTDGWLVDMVQVSSNPDELWQPEGAWATAFATDAAEEKAQLRITRALSCVARQLGRFYLETKSPPPATLQAFMIAACGAVVPQVGFQWVAAEVSDRTTDEQVLAHWRHQIKQDLLAHLPAQATDAGFWSGRAHGRLVAVMSHAAARVRWKTLSFVPDPQDDITLEGELDGAVDHISGYANQGRFGVETCAMDPSVLRPRFRAVCHIAKDDATAWVQLFAAPPRRVLATPFVQILVRRTMNQPLAFDMAPYGASRMVSTPDAFSQAVVEQLNRVRAQAGFAPVRLSAAESQSAARLAGHYFAAELTPANQDAGAEMDNIALSLLAGWQMGGMIRDGQFVSSLAPQTRDAGQWLNVALATPLGRCTLLSKEIEEVAVGPILLPDAGGLAAVVTGYRLYHGDDHTSDVTQLYARLVSARKRLGLKHPRRLGGMAEVLRTELQRVQAGTTAPSVALQASLHQGVSRFGAGMRGYVIETTSLDALEIPEDVIKRPNLALEIAVTHHKPRGAAWAQLVILVIFADDQWSPGGQSI